MPIFSLKTGLSTKSTEVVERSFFGQLLADTICRAGGKDREGTGHLPWCAGSMDCLCLRSNMRHPDHWFRRGREADDRRDVERTCARV